MNNITSRTQKSKTPVVGTGASQSVLQLSKLRRNSRSTATVAQERRALAELRNLRQVSTDQFRSIGIFCPAARIFALRCKGYVISTTLVNTFDRDGVLHLRMAWYRLERLPVGGKRG